MLFHVLPLNCYLPLKYPTMSLQKFYDLNNGTLTIYLE